MVEWSHTLWYASSTNNSLRISDCYRFKSMVSIASSGGTSSSIYFIDQLGKDCWTTSFNFFVADHEKYREKNLLTKTKSCLFLKYVATIEKQMKFILQWLFIVTLFTCVSLGREWKEKLAKAIQSHWQLTRCAFESFL